MSRDRRARATGRLGVKRGERYSLIPDEVLRSAAFRSLPDYAVRVLAALAAQCNGHNNGSLALTSTQAADYGIKRARLYAAFEVLLLSGLIVKCRQGGMKPLGVTKYGLTWRAIDEGQHDDGIAPCPIASNAWAQWTPPASWTRITRLVLRKASGKRRQEKSTVTHGGDRSITPGVTVESQIGHPRGGLSGAPNGHPRGDTSKISGGGPTLRVLHGGSP